MISHAAYVFGLESSPAGYGTIELTQGPSNRLSNQALESRRTAWEQGRESLSFCGRGSSTRGGTGRSGVRGSGPPIHVAAVLSVTLPEPSGQVRDLPLRMPRIMCRQGCQRRDRSLGCRGSRRPSASVGCWAVRRSETAHARSLTRHSCAQAPGNAIFRATNRCARASKS